jgi:heme-degrading monooxygenase HmoA
MLHIIWEFRVKPGRATDFELHYGPTGTWAQLFGGSAGYRGTELLRDSEDPQRYLTIDHWSDTESYEGFRHQFHEQYQALDRQMEELTLMENKVGVFVGM